MIITHHGCQFFKVSFGSVTLAFNPISKASKMDTSKFGADLVLVSLWHPDFNGVSEVTHGSKKPFVISTPGEFEVGDVTARGWSTPVIYHKQSYFNNIFQVRLEDMNIVFLGALNNPEIDPKILSELEDIDILFIPIGGGEVLEAPQAAKLALKLEAKLVIPMHCDDAALKAFQKETGSEAVKPVTKLTIKKREVSQMTGEVVAFKTE